MENLLNPGEIYLIDRSQLYSEHAPHMELYIFISRVVFFNDKWVFVDMKYDKDIWYLDKIRKGLIYFSPIRRYWFEKKALKIGFSEVSDKIKDWYQTNLPIYLGRIKDLSWDSEVFEQQKHLEAHLVNSQTQEWLNQEIPTDQIYLMALSKTGSTKTITLIKAECDEKFTVCELLWQAAILQRSAYNYRSKGVGIFRAGSKAGVAAYYIGEYFDRAGILED